MTVPFILFIFGLIFAPLAFGTVEQWSLFVLELATGVAYIGFFLTARSSKESVVKVPGLLPLLLLLGLMVFQLVPLPGSLVKIISPGSYDVYSPLLSLPGDGDSGWVSLSVNRRATLHEMLRIGSCVLMYIVTVQLLGQPKRLKDTVNIVVFLAAAVAFLAIVQAVGSPDRIYWIRQVPHNAHPFGPWINPNQFAGYIELICPLAFGLFLFYKPRVKGGESFRQKFVSFFTVPGIHFHLFLGFGTVLMVLAVFVSLCRGGMLSIAAAGAVFLFLTKWKFPGRGRTIFLVIVASLFLAISWFGWDIIISEFNHGFEGDGTVRDGRLTLWSDSLEIIKDFPVFGAGFGTFLSLYPLYKTIGDNNIYAHAHNDYLELLTGSGVIGFFLASWFVLSVLLHGWRMIGVRRDRYAILLGIGSTSGVAALLFHSVTDFNMHNGAVAYYFFFLCGVVVASVNIRFSHYTGASSTNPTVRSLLKPHSPKGLVTLTFFGVFLLSATLVIQGGALIAWIKHGAVADIYVNKQLSEKYLQKVADNMKRAAFWDPLEGLYSYKLGTAEWYLDDKKEALRQHLLAVKKNPLEGVFLQQLGLLVEGGNGKRFIKEGYKRALDKESLVLTYAEWLLWNDRREEARDLLADRLSRGNGEIIDWTALLNSYSFSRQELAEILPATVDAWLQYGRYCEKNGNYSDAVFFFDAAVGILSDALDPAPSWFREVIHFYRRQGQDAKSLAVLRQAVEKVPNSAYFHILLGNYYQDQGISYRAREEFERALILDPANRQARSKLRRLGYGDSYKGR